jgi:hypothetical protein
MAVLTDPEWDSMTDPETDWHKHATSGRVKIDGVIYDDIEAATRILGYNHPGLHPPR